VSFPVSGFAGRQRMVLEGLARLAILRFHGLHFQLDAAREDSPYYSFRFKAEIPLEQNLPRTLIRAQQGTLKEYRMRAERAGKS